MSLNIVLEDEKCLRTFITATGMVDAAQVSPAHFPSPRASRHRVSRARRAAGAHAQTVESSISVYLTEYSNATLHTVPIGLIGQSTFDRQVIKTSRMLSILGERERSHWLQPTFPLSVPQSQ